MMRDTARRNARQYAEFVFVAVVTALLLALVADGTRRGFGWLPAMLVFSFAAGFGLEFVSSSWRGRWRPQGRTHQPHR